MNTLDCVTLPDGSQYLYDTTKWRLVEEGETIRPGDQVVVAGEHEPTTRPVHEDWHGHIYFKGQGIMLRPIDTIAYDWAYHFDRKFEINVGTLILAGISLVRWAAVAWIAYVLYTATHR